MCCAPAEISNCVSSILIQTRMADLAETGYLEIYFPVAVKGDLWRLARNGVILGGLLAGQSVLTILSKSASPRWAAIEISLPVIFAIVTGLFVSFGMRKPL